MKSDTPWDTCAESACGGAAVGTGRPCLAHLDDLELTKVLEAIAKGESLKCQGVAVGDRLLERVLGAIDPSPGHPEHLFIGATFQDGLDFRRAKFGANANFEGAVFGESSNLQGVDFGDRPFFENAKFGNNAKFNYATFGSRASFDMATFGSGAEFRGARFGEEATFFKTSFEGTATFEAAAFGRRAIFGPITVRDSLTLDRALFPLPNRFSVVAPVLSCIRLELPDGGILNVDSQEIDFSGTFFPQSTVVTPVIYDDTESSDPRITSLRRANLERLVLNDINLADCHFQGAHNLDRLRWEGSTRFFQRERGWHLFRRRQILHEEALYRGWSNPSKESSSDVPKLQPSEIAGLYRSLRKAREDAKDEAGAADFYSGEMEMRRRSSRTWGECLILNLYKILCGYGLRASSALFILLVVVSASVGLFGVNGFANPAHPFVLRSSPVAQSSGSAPGLPQSDGSIGPRAWRTFRSFDSWVYTAGTTIGVVSASDAPVTPWGHLYRVILRVTGPLLLGLAAFSIRGRIKR